MGTRKTLVLALLVSTMMVFSFMIGVMPFHDTQDTGTSANAGYNTVMKDLLDEVLSQKQGDEVTLESRLGIDGVVVKTPEDNADRDALVIPVPLQATVSNDPAAMVTYVANEAGAASAFVGDAWPAISGTWNGEDSAVSAEYAGPSYIGALDLSGFLTGAASAQRTIAIYALVNAALDNKAAASYTYENANLGIGYYDGEVLSDGTGLNDCNDSAFTCVGEAGFGDAVSIDIFEVAGTVDGTNNGLPDSIFDAVDGVAPGEIWVANVLIGGKLRTVLVANLDDGGAKAAGNIILNPTANVQIVAPDQEALVTAGLANASDTVLVMAEVVGDLAALLDEADLTDDGTANGGAADVAAWANAVMNVAPGALVDGASYVDISILVSDGASYDEIDDLSGSGLEIELTVDGLTFDDPTKAQLWSYPTMVSDNAGVAFYTNEPGLQNWERMSDDSFTIAGSAFTANLETLSVFGMFDAGLELIDCTPSELPQNLPYNVTLTGILPLASALNMAEATAAYTIYFNGVAATFQDVPEAITMDNPNQLFVVAPALATVGDVEIEIRDAVNPANSFALAAAAAVTATSTIAATAEAAAGSDPGYAPAVTFSYAPTGGAGLPAGVYFPNDAVTVAAAYDTAVDRLDGWAFNSVDLGNTSSQVQVNLGAGANALVATFSEATVVQQWALVVQEGVGGSVEINPMTPGLIYNDGDAVALTAVAEANYEFVNWTGDVADIADPSALTINFTMTADRTITANFQAVQGDPMLAAITPAEAPIFGGVVAQLQGANLTENLTITIGGVVVTGFRAAADGSTIDIVVPASADASQDPLVVVDVEVTDGTNPSTLPNAFTYKRYWVKDGVSLTADILDPTADETVQVSLGAPHNNFAQLFVPQLDVPTGVNSVYIIAQNSQFQTVKQNTPALGTSLIGAGEAIPNSFDFSVHLYAADVAKNTPPAGSGALGNASGLIEFGRPVDETGAPIASNPMTLTIPIADTDITYGDVRDGLTFWGIASEFDYVTEVTTVTTPEVVEYQSMLLNDEVDPALTADTLDSAEPNMVMEGRLYSLNGFTLRQSAVLPQEVIEGIRLATTSGTANGDVAGGTALSVVSPLGGLAWVDRVELSGAAKAVGGTANESNFVTVPGTDEYNFEFTTPASDDPGIVDLVIYLKSSDAPAVTLSRVFEYTRASKPIDNIVLIGIGLLVAIIGLLAGGSSGGGGGGPCFIASAAYGTPLAAEVDTLRSVRDSFMLNNTLGTAFVDTYYRVSPAIADVVAQSPVLAALVRVLLVPVIFLGKVALAMPSLSALVGLSLGFAYLRRRRARGCA